MSSSKPEIIEISTSEKTPSITLNKEPPTSRPNTPVQHDISKKPSVNFGSGIELLMNDKRKNDGSESPKTNINIDDINNLEHELNDLADTKNKESIKAPTKSGMFNKILTNPLDVKKDSIG